MEYCRRSGAKLDSYGRNRLGLFVPVQKSDFGCCGPLFGGELALQKAKLDPCGSPKLELLRFRIPAVTIAGCQIQISDIVARGVRSDWAGLKRIGEPRLSPDSSTRYSLKAIHNQQ